jgi:hypothetical protein
MFWAYYKTHVIRHVIRKLLGIEAAVNYIKRQQIKWSGHVIRQKELNITQRITNKKY